MGSGGGFRYLRCVREQTGTAGRLLALHHQEELEAEETAVPEAPPGFGAVTGSSV